MNILLSTIGRRGYIAQYFRKHLEREDQIIGTSDRNSLDSELTPGFDYCDKNYLVPPIKSNNYIESLLRICKKHSVKLLCSLYDLDNYILSFHNKRIEDNGVVSFISAPTVNEICFDKLKCYQFLKSNGYETPATFSKIQEFQDSCNEFPVIVKPRFGFGSSNIFTANNLEQLSVLFNFSSNMIIQNFICGDEYGIDTFNDFSFNTISVIVKKKILMRAGETDQAVTIKDNNLIELGVKLSRSLKHVGPLDVDCILSNGACYVLEMNPRFGGGYPLSYAAGVDFTKFMVDIVEGRCLVPQIGDYKSGVVMYKEINIKIMDQANGKTHPRI